VKKQIQFAASRTVNVLALKAQARVREEELANYLRTAR
jgi:hypothetical protein